ncbi:MAG: hypothetical protein EOP48_16495, partial [Sphingobacteriales bacterium]
MNGYIFRTLSIIILMFLAGTKTMAQAFKFLIPDAAIVQHAGSVGYLSVGAGYSLFKNNRGSLDATYGFVPRSKGGELHIAALKFAYRPFEIKVKDWGRIYPLNPGFFISYTFDKALSFNFNTVQYEKGYYYWSEAARPHLSFSNEIELNARKIIGNTKIKMLSLYTEFNTNDYY